MYIQLTKSFNSVKVKVMKKKWLCLILCSLITISPINLLANELSAITPSCCCETLCECTHEKNNTPILRNVTCGDNLPGSLPTPSSKQLIGDLGTQLHPIQSIIASNAPAHQMKNSIIATLPTPPPRFLT